MPRLNFVVRVAVCFLFVFLPLHTLDQWFYDHFFRLRGALSQPSPFILVRVNDAKLYQVFGSQSGSFPREEFSFEPKVHSIWYQDFYESLLRQIQLDEPRLIILGSFYEWIDKRKTPQLPYPNLLYAAVL